MKIGINGQRLLSKDPAGPEKYTYNLINALAKIDRSNQYVIFFTSEPDAEYFKKLTYSNAQFTYKTIPKKYSWTQYSLAKELLRNPIDIFFTPVHTMPIIHSKTMKVVGMIHGLEYKFSHGFKNPIKRMLINKPEKYLCKHSDELIVPTLATKLEIVKRKWIKDPDKKIAIIPEGVNDAFYKRDSQEISEVRIKYNLGENPYLLFVSTIQPRKNIPATIEAFSKMLKSRPDLLSTKLVIVGKSGWDTEASFEAPKKYGVEHNVLFLGRAPDADLPPLFSGAAGFVNLSLEEGFGLPLLEAMACQTPALVSNIPAFKEVGGPYPLYANPVDTDEISKNMSKLLDGSYETESIKGALERAENFTWDKTAERTLSVFQKAVENS